MREVKRNNPVSNPPAGIATPAAVPASLPDMVELARMIKEIHAVLCGSPLHVVPADPKAVRPFYDELERRRIIRDLRAGNTGSLKRYQERGGIFSEEKAKAIGLI